MEAVSYGVGALALGLVMWVYFDAAERGKNAILWALITALTSGLAFFFYLLMRDSGPQRPPVRGAVVRNYLYVAAFCGAFLVSVGLSVGLGALLMGAFADEGLTSSGRDAFASGVVAAVVGIVVVVVHWLVAERRIADLPDDEFRAQFATRRLMLQTVLAINALTGVFSALVFFGGGLAELLGASYAYAALWVPAVAPLLATGSVGLLAWRTWFKTDHDAAAERFRALPEPTIERRTHGGYYAPATSTLQPYAPTAATPPTAPTVAQAPAPTAENRCTRCGTPAERGDRFCRSCGLEIMASSMAGATGSRPSTS